MTTTEADPNTSRLAAMRTLLSGAEWARVAAMVGVIVALHLIGWVTLAAFVAPHHFSVGGKALGLGVGLTAYTLHLRHAFDALALLLSVGAKAIIGPVQDVSSAVHRYAGLIGTSAADLPVAVLLGGEVKSLDAYDSFGILDIKTDLPRIEASVDSGFEAIKIKLGACDAADDVATVAAIRKLIGAKRRLMIDLNQSQTTASAIDRILRLKEFDLTWVEAPVAADDLQGHRAVREAVRPVPIQTGENWWFPHGMANAIAARASDLTMIDIMKIGAVTGWISAAGQAEAASLPLSSHTFIEASAHTMASSPTASWFEYLDLAGPVLTERPWRRTKAKSFPEGPALVSNGTSRRLENMHLSDVTKNDLRAPSMTEAS
jgi:hypothetical protein